MKKIKFFVLPLLLMMFFLSCEQLEDIFDQLENVFENDNNSNESWKFVYAENYVDSLNAIFSNEGYVALFGGTEICLNSNTDKLERTIYVAKADFEAGIVDEDNATLIVVDSTYMPIHISSKKCIIRFSPFENGNFSCLVKYGEEDEWTEYDGFNIETYKTTSELHTRSLATGGVSDFTIANALKALDIINGIKGCFQATSMKECVSEGVGVFSNFSPNDEIGITGGLISAGLTKSLSSGLLSILSYVGDKISDGPLKYLGPVKLSIENVEQLDAQSCKIGYMVDGLHEYGMANSDLYFELRNVKTGKYYPRLYLEPKNGYDNAIIANLEPGEYGIILHIRTKKYNWEYATYPEVKFQIINTEREKLIELYNYTKGDEWLNNTNWCSERPLNEWYGIKQDSLGYVISIDLSNNNLTGYAQITFDDFSNLSTFNIDNNNIKEIYIRGNDNINEITLTNCATEHIGFENFNKVSISCESLNSISGECDVLNVSNCDFGENDTPFLGISVKDATIYNCKMHSCGLSSEILTFESSSTYDTWYCNTSKRLNIINSYCSTICSGDFNDGTIINLQNATLWRSNWDEESRVTLTCTITGAGWDNLFR